ncbi:MAG: hypothetical protein K1Y02_04115 [Candidatus Hydrogenedentes bacterium]|nr:hypothetical protein [Candidatus Hydrogenedentota bacterium]
MSLKRSALLVGMLLGSSFVGGMVAILATNGSVSAEENVVRSQRFEAIDAEGRPGARLGVNSEGKSYLELLDKAGKMRVSLGVNPNGATSIGVMGKDERKRAEMLMGADDLPTMVLTDRSGKTGVMVRFEQQETPTLAILDAQGGPIATLVKGESGEWKWNAAQPPAPAEAAQPAQQN